MAVNSAERVKEILKTYGLTAVVFHSSVYCLSLGSCFVAIRNGFDSQALLESWGLASTSIPTEAGELAAAWVVCAATGPVRGLMTITGVPIIATLRKKTMSAVVEDRIATQASTPTNQKTT